ncbi:helix-turn-helix transcriptional regulator [Acidovorax sp. HMWF029]|uniref:helix-turn-helix transcriptional regulator n=1 Tax=Acidovorax sp. HMWF029 TaxID=2056863 RepID=UPI001E54359B|nr:helix-turn-helix transcriptional regulator [Acidovorax sp. HMWF029]
MPSQNTKPTDYPQAVLQQIALLAQNIVIARKRRKETQAQWAQRLGVSQPTMARIERGDPSVSMASYVMCMWLINQAQGLAELIAPQNDLASLEQEVARARPRRAARAAAPSGALAAVGNAKPAALPSVSATNAPTRLGAAHFAQEAEGFFQGTGVTKPMKQPPQKAAGMGHEEQIQQALQTAGLSAPERAANSTAAGLAALISGQKKARP